MKFNLGLSNQISRTFQELKMFNSKFLDSGLCTKNECSSCFNFFIFYQDQDQSILTKNVVSFV